jgi:hypothetical protein
MRQEGRLATPFAEALLVAAGAVGLAGVLTYPFILELATAGRIDNSDGQFSIWNVAWVARALVRDPLHVFDANIFYPHRGTLAYSESNLGAGALAIPAWWMSRNPYLAHNTAVILGLALTALGTYYLVRHLTGDRFAAAVSAICFTFCPYIFARTSHIQLMMTAGIPFAMLAFERVADRPTPGRAAVLGLVMAVGAAFCGYYAIFVGLMIALAVLLVAAMARRWTDRAYWTAVVVAALVGIVAVAPIFAPYVLLRRSTGFGRALEEAARYSANWRAYLASNESGSIWMLAYLFDPMTHAPLFSETLFPGFVALVSGVAGAVVALSRKGRSREAAVVYLAIGTLAFWASFGPDAYLYTALYRVIPVFAWLRAPARFGVLVAFALSVLAGFGVAAISARRPYGRVVATVIAALAASELFVAIPLREAPPLSPAYQMLRRLPPGPVIELPYFAGDGQLHGHAQYMLNSTSHWLPLINGYSDYLPEDFLATRSILERFPNAEAFKVLEGRMPRYAVFHMSVYGAEDQLDANGRIAAFSRNLRPLYVDKDVRLYEIVGSPGPR